MQFKPLGYSKMTKSIINSVVWRPGTGNNGFNSLAASSPSTKAADASTQEMGPISESSGTITFDVTVSLFAFAKGEIEYLSRADGFARLLNV